MSHRAVLGPACVLQALLGRARVLELKKQLPVCLDVLTEINVRFSWFVPALVEKTRLLVQLNDWDQATEHIQRILTADPQNIMAQAWQGERASGGQRRTQQ